MIDKKCIKTCEYLVYYKLKLEYLQSLNFDIQFCQQNRLYNRVLDFVLCLYYYRLNVTESVNGKFDIVLSDGNEGFFSYNFLLRQI